MHTEQLGHPRPISPSEMKLLPEAAKQVDEEWEKLRTRQTWIEDRVCEYAASRKRALEEDRETQLGRRFAL